MIHYNYKDYIYRIKNDMDKIARFCKNIFWANSLSLLVVIYVVINSKWLLNNRIHSKKKREAIDCSTTHLTRVKTILSVRSIKVPYLCLESETYTD